MNTLAFKLFAVLTIELTIYVSLGLWYHLSTGLIVLLWIGLSLLIRLVTLFLLFTIAWVSRSPRPSDLHIHFWQTLQLVGTEFAALLALYYVLHPFERWLVPHNPPQSNPQQLPIVLVHGFFCNSGYWWAMRRYLLKQGLTNIFTLNLEPIFSDIDHFAQQLQQRVEAICKSTGATQVIIVGHSMGGLVARQYVQCYGGQGRVAKLITLGSPHYGTTHAHWLVGMNIQQMRPNNPWLVELNTKGFNGIPVTSIYSAHDNLIAPQVSSALAEADNKVLAGIGHLAMVFSQAIQALVSEEIKKGQSH